MEKKKLSSSESQNKGESKSQLKQIFRRRESKSRHRDSSGNFRITSRQLNAEIDPMKNGNKSVGNKSIISQATHVLGDNLSPVMSPSRLPFISRQSSPNSIFFDSIIQTKQSQESEKTPPMAKPFSSSKKSRNSLVPAKLSQKNYGSICAYAANSVMGPMHKTNDERVSIVLNIKDKTRKSLDSTNSNQDKKSQKSPSLREDPLQSKSFFAIFDGHGGNECSDYLADNFHLMVISFQTSYFIRINNISMFSSSKMRFLEKIHPKRSGTHATWPSRASCLHARQDPSQK